MVKYSHYGNSHPLDHYVEFSRGNDQIMAWIGLSRAGVVLGPHFVRGNLDTQEYLRIIRYHIIQREFQQHQINRYLTWWQQDGAPAHTSTASINYLRGQFLGKLMSKRRDWPWPPRSPDLTFCDFFRYRMFLVLDN